MENTMGIRGGLVAGMLAILTLPAPASDLGPRSSYAANPVVGAYSWTGAYLGVNVGSRWGQVSNGGSSSGWAAGGQAGLNWQAGQFVFGGETDLQLSGSGDTFAAWQFSNPWFGTLRGRAGFAMNNMMFYATAGLAYGGLQAQLAGASESRGHVGWTAGGGMEVGLTPKLSAKAEYLYMDLADRGYVLTGNSIGLEGNLLRLGVNYRF
jgi:outer membrane immunogenic protein